MSVQSLLEDRIASKVRDLPDPKPVKIRVCWYDRDLEEEYRTGNVVGDLNDASFCLRLIAIAREHEIETQFEK